MSPRGRLRSLAVSFPAGRRTNDHWRAHHPEAVADAGARSLARVWSPPSDGAPGSIFVEEMAPYLADPFRGAVERRVLAPGDGALALEVPAARRALAAAGLGPDDIDLLVVSAFLPDSLGVGDAAFLARALDLRCPAWNLESACSGALVGLEVAAALCERGPYRRALVVVSCCYSRTNPDEGSLSWSVGDGAAAFVVEPATGDDGLLGMATVSTAAHAGAMTYELEAATAGPRVRMVAGPRAAASLRAISERDVPTCCDSALAAAGVTLADVAFFVVPTPVAWYARFCARLLGFPLERTLDSHAAFANTGPVLMPTNLFLAATRGLVRPGDLVLLLTVGVVANVSAAVVRWGDVALGLAPELEA